ncbi:MAG: 3-dehydroquinate synthase [Bacteroidales bacterium]
MNSSVIFTSDSASALQQVFNDYGVGNVYFVFDENTSKACFPLIQDVFDGNKGKVLMLPSGEKNKTIEKVVNVWQFLHDRGATRKSALVNVGGGLLSDLCGFAASTFKRGIDFINIPTTLLSQVDASVGGKTGINFNNIKNEIGVFKIPRKVIIDTTFLKTLPEEAFKSGFSEMLKHGLIHDCSHYEELTRIDVAYPDYTQLSDIVKKSVEIKQKIVEQDFKEEGLRKSLNFGHTAGHAFETFAMEENEPVPHGYAVAYGMIVELYLSSKKTSLSDEAMSRVVSYLMDTYGRFSLDIQSHTVRCRLIELMRHDKKNENDNINFTFLTDIGECVYNQYCEEELIDEALVFFKDLNVKFL